jgi:hypothetical protein
VKEIKMPDEVAELIEELIRPSPEEVYGEYPTEEEMEEMARRDHEFEVDRAYDAIAYKEAA